MSTEQFSFFDAGPSLPEGFRYQPEVISREREAALVAEIEPLPFKEFQFHGYQGKRRVVSFGWKYDYSARTIFRSSDIPAFIFPIREIVARFAGMDSDALQQVLVTEYSPGSAIGWHRDKPEFGQIVGLSLLAACTFRLRRKSGDGWERVSIVAEPRSAYLMSGPSRSEWEHSIPPVDSLRYSITFRNLREATTQRL